MLTSHMFRRSTGHLQADISNILRSIQIMCGTEISFLQISSWRWPPPQMVETCT